MSWAVPVLSIGWARPNLFEAAFRIVEGWRRRVREESWDPATDQAHEESVGHDNP